MLIYITGITQSSDFPVTENSYKTKVTGGLSSAFITKYDLEKDGSLHMPFIKGNSLSKILANNLNSYLHNIYNSKSMLLNELKKEFSNLYSAMKEDAILCNPSKIFNDEFSSVIYMYDKNDGEIGLLYDVLNKYKINDVELMYDDKENLIAMDDENIWYGTEFYKFIFDEVFN